MVKQMALDEVIETRKVEEITEDLPGEDFLEYLKRMKKLPFEKRFGTNNED